MCFCAGCTQNTDNAKIEALSQKIDYLTQVQATIYSNQTALYSEVERLHDFNYKLETNTLWALAMQENSIEENVNRSIAASTLVTLSNSLTVAQSKIQIDQIQLDLYETSEKINSIKTDVSMVKVKLGIQ